MHIFSCTDTLDIPTIEGYILNNIYKKEDKKIKDIKLPIEGSYEDNYSKLVRLIHQLQTEGNHISDEKIDNIYKEGKKIINTYDDDDNLLINGLNTLKEVIFFIIFSFIYTYISI